MGASYRDYVKGRNRASDRARQEVDRQAAVDARAKAIREKNRKSEASQAQYQARLDGFE